MRSTSDGALAVSLTPGDKDEKLAKLELFYEGEKAAFLAFKAKTHTAVKASLAALQLLPPFLPADKLTGEGEVPAHPLLTL